MLLDDGVGAPQRVLEAHMGEACQTPQSILGNYASGSGNLSNIRIN